MMPSQPAIFYLAFAEKGKLNGFGLWLALSSVVRLLHHRQPKIIPVGAFVVHLKLVDADDHGRGIRKVPEGTGNRSRGDVTNGSEDCTAVSFLFATALKINCAPDWMITPVAITLSAFPFLV